MLTRYLIVHPGEQWIQGDIPATNPHDAVSFLESKLRQPATTQHDWLVFEAPRNFPPQASNWSGGDPNLIEILGAKEPVATIPQCRAIAAPQSVYAA